MQCWGQWSGESFLTISCNFWPPEVGGFWTGSSTGNQMWGKEWFLRVNCYEWICRALIVDNFWSRKKIRFPPKIYEIFPPEVKKATISGLTGSPPSQRFWVSFFKYMMCTSFRDPGMTSGWLILTFWKKVNFSIWSISGQFLITNNSFSFNFLGVSCMTNVVG